MCTFSDFAQQMFSVSKSSKNYINKTLSLLYHFDYLCFAYMHIQLHCTYAKYIVRALSECHDALLYMYIYIYTCIFCSYSLSHFPEIAILQHKSHFIFLLYSCVFNALQIQLLSGMIRQRILRNSYER